MTQDDIRRNLRICAMQDECIDIIENYGEGMTRQDATCLFGLVKERIISFWESEYGNS